MIFKNKIALVTGASRGIGRAIAETLIKHNINVIGTATSQNGICIIDSYLQNKGKGLLLNINDTESIKQVVDTINYKFGSIDILINNAGITCDNLLMRMKEEEWQDVLNTNLTGIFRITKAVIPSMLKKRMGRIINLGSVVGTMGNSGQINYASTKAGLVGFSKSLAREIASRGITVNVVAPGFIKTDMIKKLSAKQCSNILAKIPLGRLGKVEEIANTVLFLISEQASYITGETINVNGGLYMI
ncbi:MAG: 3-oxoacyl-ACP reductase FabG [Pantoea sp. Brub]|nr:3-oxoacyl-ACP reductase FabG [Pantoea sp. Brub]